MRTLPQTLCVILLGSSLVAFAQDSNVERKQTSETNVNGLVTPPEWVVLHPNEPDPIYKGKKLDVWLEGWHPLMNGQESSSNRGSPEWQKAEEAVRHAGVSAVPVLLRMIQSGDQIASARAVEVFGILDSAAQAAAMPGLIEVYNRSIAGTSHNYESVIQVWSSRMVPAVTNAIPSLLRGVTNAGSSSSVRAQSIMALGRIHAEPELVVPQLIKSLSDRDERVREIAASYLGDFGVDAREAVPSLLERFSDTSAYVRRAATNSLKKIGGDAASKAGVK